MLFGVGDTMTVGQKISYLRIKKGLTQDELAEELDVSRQSVSKWEMGLAVPHVEKVLKICDLFSISTDSLLRDEMSLDVPETFRIKTEVANGKNKYFGTDGFRGEANVDLTYEHAFKVGRFLGWYYGNSVSGCFKYGYRPRVVIGKDTRRSSYMLEYSLIAGLTASGADVSMLHVTTTPSLSYITRQDEFDCGIIISASHNPFYDNGIKIVNRYGEKIDDYTASLIEMYIDGNTSEFCPDGGDLPVARREKLGCISEYSAGRNRYMGYLISVASHSYKKLKIGLDCANGASWTIAKAVFDALGAQTYLTGASPDGLNINDHCGSTDISGLKELVREKHLDVGFAFDGDADRCIAVDENGNEVNGDHILYILAVGLKKQGRLDKNTIVATVMSNTGLLKALRNADINYELTAVGDRFVYENMQKNGYKLGGEQSGHIILKKYATTGDGILTAIMIAEEMCENKSTLSKLAAPVKIYPQVLKNLKVPDRTTVMKDPAVLAAVKNINEKLDGNGRILLRESGTEPVIRIMVESPTKAECDKYIEQMVSLLGRGGYCIE